MKRLICHIATALNITNLIHSPNTGISEYTGLAIKAAQ